MKTVQKKHFLLITLFCFGFCFAGPPAEGPPVPPLGPPPPPGMPVDNRVGILAAAAVSYGFYAISRQRRNKKRVISR